MVTTGGLGDAILFSPVFRAVRRSRPDAAAVLLVASGLVRDAYAGAAEITRTEVLNTNRRYSPVTYAGLLRLGARFRRDGGVRLLVLASRSSPRLCRLITWVCRPQQVLACSFPDRDRPDLEVNVALAQAVAPGATAADVFVPVPEAAVSRARELLGPGPRAPGRGAWLAVYPSVDKHERPRWPLTSLVRVVTRAAAACGAGVVVVGSAAEGKEWDQAWTNQGVPLLNLAGRLGILETAAVLQQVRGALCNDGGIMHLAGAVGCPLVGIMPNADPCHRPAGEASVLLTPQALLCHPCCPRRPRWCKDPAACVTGISEDRVQAAADQGLRAGAEG
jgi:ADP-heptose:LPS heptosyltransferase